jgi:hypothetical protein
MMGFGTFLLVVVFATFVVTHMIRYDADLNSGELAATLALIMFVGFLIYGVLYFLRGML